MRIGSLFSGAAGLDRAVESVFGGGVVWHCELDPAASKVLAHRYPGVPNHRDITKVDWASVEPVDVLCGGYPCQPFSSAGQRKGSTDERHLWPYFAEAIRHLRPGYVVLENVAGHRSMGFDSVLADLAGLRYDAQWVSVRAADVGAPHRRERLFVVAHPEYSTGYGEWARPQLRQGDQASPDANSGGCEVGAEQHGEPLESRVAASQRDDSLRSGVGPVELLPTPTQADWGRGSVHPDRRKELNPKHSPELHELARHGFLGGELLPTPRSSRGASTTETSYALGGTRSDADRTQGEVLLPTPSVADGMGGHISRSGSRSNELLLPGIVRELLPTPNASDGSGGGQDPSRREGHTRQLIDYVLVDETQWGKYEPAIRRWEQLTRPAPPPTEPNTKGNPRLSAAFSEWMLGWPAGWVTAVPGITRNDQLRIIGNGVVPQQAIAALSWLLSLEVAA